MNDKLPWILAAGEFLSRCHQELASPSHIQRASAESWLGVAKAEFKRSTEQISFLSRCFVLEFDPANKTAQ